MTTDTPGPGRHRTDLLSLIFGLFFLAGAGVWAAQHYLDVPWLTHWRLPHLGWIVAGALILAGLLGILASLRAERPEPPAVDAPEVDRPTATDAGP